MTKYILAILAVALALAIGTAAIYRGNAAKAYAEAAQARADLNVAVDANRAQEEAIGRLRAEAVFNDKLLVKMSDDLTSITRATAATTKAVNDLKESNDDVRQFLGTIVPPDLRKLYEHP